MSVSGRHLDTLFHHSLYLHLKKFYPRKILHTKWNTRHTRKGPMISWAMKCILNVCFNGEIMFIYRSLFTPLSGFFYHVKFIKGRKNTQCLSICLVLYFTSFTALLYKLCPHILLLQCVVHGSKDQWTQMTTCSSTIRQGQRNIYFMHESHGLHLKGTKSCDHFRSVDWPCYINIWLVVKIKRHTWGTVFLKG